MIARLLLRAASPPGAGAALPSQLSRRGPAGPTLPGSCCTTGLSGDAAGRLRMPLRGAGKQLAAPRGEEKETSDVDVLVEFEKPTFRNFMGLVFFLEELLGREVDLVTIKGLSPYLRPHVEGEVVWSE